jgi:hypothetical protein
LCSQIYILEIAQPKTKSFFMFEALQKPKKAKLSFPDLICSSLPSEREEKAARNNVIYIFIRINGLFSSYIFSRFVPFFCLAWRCVGDIKQYILFATKRTQFSQISSFMRMDCKTHTESLSHCIEIITPVQCNYFNCQFTQKLSG